ncbi:MAG: Helix-turn-helix domain [Neobacillus sp.]|nr:Helix-turn-helix domain [Neobacillus sp.]
MDIKEKVFLTIDETASYLGLPKTTIYELTKGKEFPAKKLGKSWRVHRQNLDLWCANVCK